MRQSILVTADVDSMIAETEAALSACVESAADRPRLEKFAHLWAYSFRQRRDALHRLRRKVELRTFNPESSAIPKNGSAKELESDIPLVVLIKNPDAS